MSFRISPAGMRQLGFGAGLATVRRVAAGIGARFVGGAPTQIARGRSASPALWSGDARSLARAAMGSGKRFRGRGRSHGVQEMVSAPTLYQAQFVGCTAMGMRGVEQRAGQHLQRRTGAMEHIMERARNDAEREALKIARGTVPQDIAALVGALRHFATKATAHPVKQRLEANAARLREVEARYQGMKELGLRLGIA